MRILYVHARPHENPDDLPEQNIISIGGNIWRASVGSAIESIHKGSDSFYIEVEGRRVDVVPVEGRHGWYLRASRQGEFTDDLTHVPPFPEAFGLFSNRAELGG